MKNLMSQILDIFDTIIPCQIKYQKSRPKTDTQEHSDFCKREKNYCDILHEVWQNDLGNTVLKKAYFQQRKDYRLILDEEKINNNSMRIRNSNNKSHESWKIVRENTVYKKINQTIIKELYTDEKKETKTINPHEIANILNNFFVNTPKIIHQRLESKTDFNDYSLTYVKPIQRNNNTFILEPVSTNEIEQIINSLLNLRAQDINNISTNLLKQFSSFSSIAPLLALIINESFKSGIFSEELKMGKILFKSGDPADEITIGQ